jgi:porin
MMRLWLKVLRVLLLARSSALGQEDKKTDDLKPADPDTGESTVEERIGFLPNPFEKSGVKFAVTYIGGTPLQPGRRGKAARLSTRNESTLQSMPIWKRCSVSSSSRSTPTSSRSMAGLVAPCTLQFLVVSGIEALPTTRLYEMWFEKKWGTKLALRAGLAADTEFMTAKYTDVSPMLRSAGQQGFLNM